MQEMTKTVHVAALIKRINKTLGLHEQKLHSTRRGHVARLGQFHITDHYLKISIPDINLLLLACETKALTEGERVVGI